MTTKSWGVIYCPKEGSPHTHRRWRHIKKYLDNSGVDYDFVQSEAAGAVERLAQMMTRSGHNTIIVVGGDSALNHALCGIMEEVNQGYTCPTLGVIPNGLGNDFAKYWGFSADKYKECIDALLNNHTRKVDVGQVTFTTAKGVAENLYFLNCINIGVAASITHLRRKTRSIFGLNTVSYLISSLLLLFQKMSYKFQMHIDGETTPRKGMTICIGSAHGYGQTPSAVPYNGMLDLTLVSTPKAVQLIHGLWLLFTGRFLSHKGIEVWRTKHVSLQSEGKATASIDGRVIHKPIISATIHINQEAIDFLIP